MSVSSAPLASQLPTQKATQKVSQMVTQQVRAWHVTDPRVLHALEQLHREPFVPPSLLHLACADLELPLANGAVMLAPKVEGRILQSLQPKFDEQALVIGAGNAHLAGCLAALVRKVTLADANAALLEQGRQQLLAQALNNIAVLQTSLAALASPPIFDLVVVTGALPAMPDHLPQMLSVGGRLFAIIGKSPVMEAVLLTRRSNTEWSSESLFETDLPLLPGVTAPAEFNF